VKKRKYIQLSRRLVGQVKGPIAKHALRQAASTEAQDVSTHFKKHGWDLDWDDVKESVFYDAFGFHLSDVVLEALLQARVNFALVSKEGVLYLRKGTRPLPKGPLKPKLYVERKKSRRGKK